MLRNQLVPSKSTSAANAWERHLCARVSAPMGKRGAPGGAVSVPAKSD